LNVERWTLSVERLRNLAIASVNKMSKKSSKSRGQSKNRRRWSARVTQRSNALDLQSKVFRSTTPRQIALSLKRSAQASKRRKGTPYQSAMSMLNFYINRAGKNLPQKQKRILERAKDELRDVFGRTESSGRLRNK
jgi:putative cell wall-binding protein